MTGGDPLVENVKQPTTHLSEKTSETSNASVAAVGEETKRTRGERGGKRERERKLRKQMRELGFLPSVPAAGPAKNKDKAAASPKRFGGGPYPNVTRPRAAPSGGGGYGGNYGGGWDYYGAGTDYYGGGGGAYQGHDGGVYAPQSYGGAYGGPMEPPPPAFPIQEYGFFSTSVPGVAARNVKSAPNRKDEGANKPPGAPSLITPSAKTVPKGPLDGMSAPGRPFIPPPTTGPGANALVMQRDGSLRPFIPPPTGKNNTDSPRPLIPPPTPRKFDAHPTAPSAPSVPPPGPPQPSLHELFGKMVWKKMEQIKDVALVDRLQAEIMNLINEAVNGQLKPKPKPEPEAPEQNSFSGPGYYTPGADHTRSYSAYSTFPSGGYTSFEETSSVTNPWGRSLGSGTF